MKVSHSLRSISCAWKAERRAARNNILPSRTTICRRSIATGFRLPHVGWGHRDQGIAHVIAPELGIAQPGMLITCNDSHTATNGACGALAVPVGGGNQLRHVVATQTVWLKKPKTLRMTIDGALPAAVTAKDVILSIIRDIGIGGATGYAVEYSGSAIDALS